MQSKARLVIIGAGIVGCAAAWHLARRGWRDMVLIDAGPLFRTGGSTSHAPGGLSQISASKMLTRFSNYALPLYAGLSVDGRPGAWLVGGLELARSEERWAELKRRQGFGRSFGVECGLMTPAECKAVADVIDERRILGGLFSPQAGIGAPTVIAEALARAAMAEGALACHGETRVTGLTIEGGRIRGVVTDKGAIAADQVLLCAGMWGPVIAAMAGLTLPLQPMQHQFVKLGPVAHLAATGKEVAYPILRAHDHDMYCRQYGDLFGIGNYDHAPLPVEPEALALAGPGRPMPSALPFTPAHFARAHAAARELFPMLEGAPIVEAFNGMFSFTPDGMPIMGPSAVKGLWLAEAIWITHAGGAGKAIAEWMEDGAPEIDCREADCNRFHAHALTRSYIRTRAIEQYKYVHAVVHPMEPMSTPRPIRRTPFHARYQAEKAVFFEASGWERPQWCEANAPLLEGANFPTRSGWAARHWSPVQAAEHLATRAGAALYDMSTFVKIEIDGPDALALLQRLCSNQIDVAPGRVVYTAMLNHRGGILSDVTVVRIGARRFRVLAGAAGGMRDLAWIRAQAEAMEARAGIRDVTSAYAALGLWGPRSREILARAGGDDVSAAALPYYAARAIAVGQAPVLAMRLSYVGELGFELYTPAEYALHVWDRLWEIGRPLGLIAAGAGAMDSLRIEKGYRRLGSDITADDTPFEAGMAFVVSRAKGDFLGRAALDAAPPPARRLACLTLDDPGAVVFGREPILAGGGVVGHVTSANFGYSVERPIAFGYLPAEMAEPGRQVAIEYFGEALSARVAAGPLFDPAGTRLRA